MSKSTIPPHVSPDRVRDIDLYDLPGASEDVGRAHVAARVVCRMSAVKATKFKETRHAQGDNTIPR